ncbi:MAG: DNA replication/repair protein RecF [Chlamydiota bacterium]
MYLRKLRLRNFRNYTDQVFTFSSGLNLVSGDNAQGKTSVIEAISLLSTGRSFRTSFLQELVRKGADFFSIEAKICEGSLSLESSLELFYHRGKKKMRYNASSYPSFLPALGLLPSVIHLPADIELVQGSPLIRRKFCNIHLAQKNPLYARYLLRYQKAMKQRNAALKRPGALARPKLLQVWEQEMVGSGSYITQERQNLLGHLEPKFQEHIDHFSGGKEEARCIFCPSVHTADEEESFATKFLKRLEQGRLKEAKMGTSLTGPHRDDFTLEIEKLPAKKFASQGQKYSVASALRLAEWELLSESFARPAIFCIDDFGLGLDQKRQTLLQGKFSQMGQVFLTAPHFSFPFCKELIPLFSVEEGSASRVL